MNRFNEIITFLTELEIATTQSGDTLHVNRDAVENLGGPSEILGAVKEKFGKGYLWAGKDDNYYFLQSIY